MTQQTLYYDSIRDAILSRLPPPTTTLATTLADACGGTPAWRHIYRYLRGEKDMTGEKLDRLASVVGVRFAVISPPPPA